MTGGARQAASVQSAAALRHSPARRGVFLAALVACAMALGWLPFTICPFANLFGQPCPGCGMTRAILALLRFDLSASSEYHPMAPWIAPLALVFLFDTCWRYVFGRPLRIAQGLLRPFTTNSNYFWTAAAVGLLAVWISRWFGSFGGPVPIHPLPGAPALLSVESSERDRSLSASSQVHTPL